MLEIYFRPFYQKILVDPLVVGVGKYLSPNKITFLACFTGILVLPALFLHQIAIGCGLVLLSGYLDTLDGSIARANNTTSSIGTAFDIVSDRTVESAIIIGLFFIDPLYRAGLALGMLGSVLLCVTSFLVVGIFTENTSGKAFHYSPGLIERTEAFIFFILMLLLPNYFQTLATLFIFLVLLTTYLRLREFVSLENMLCKTTTSPKPN